MQRKLEHFQKLAHSMRVSRDSFKKQLRKTTMYCEELFSEYETAIAERDKLVALLHETENENASIHFLGDTITQRVGHLKEQLKVYEIYLSIYIYIFFFIIDFLNMIIVRSYTKVPNNT